MPHVPPTLKGKPRRSYVLWQEILAPLIALEFVSVDGSEERDTTPVDPQSNQKAGKFWVYEQAIRIPFYGIYEASIPSLELYHLVDGHYQLVPANQRGHYPIPEMGVEMGLWRGTYLGATLTWIRWWDLEGILLPTPEERAERLADKLRELGVDPDTL
jgi:Uma2 family endonuclease